MAGEKKRRMSELAPAPHLEAADLEGDTVVTIRGFDWHPVGKERVIKGVLYFAEFERGMVINKTNRVILQHLFGNVLDAIVGQRITLYVAETTFEGKLVPCLRIRGQRPVSATPQTRAAQQVSV